MKKILSIFVIALVLSAMTSCDNDCTQKVTYLQHQNDSLISQNQVLQSVLVTAMHEQANPRPVSAYDIAYPGDGKPKHSTGNHIHGLNEFPGKMTVK